MLGIAADEDAAVDLWDDSELAALLAHQLSSHIVADAALASAELARRCAACCARSNAAPPTYASSLFDQAAPLDLLRIVKEIAKTHRAHGSDAVRRVAGVIYYAAILAARLRHGQRISDLHDGQLLQGIERTLAQPWLDARLRALFEQAARALQAA